MLIIYITSFLVGFQLWISSPDFSPNFYYLLSEKKEVDKKSIQIEEKSIKKIAKKYKFKWYPSSVAQNSDINRISATFEGELPLKMDDVRDLYFEVAAELLKPFNMDLELRQHIVSPPYDMKNLFLVLYHSPSIKQHERDRVITLLNRPKDDMIWFEKITETGDSNVAFKETIKEALEKVDPEVREKFIEATKLK